MRRATTEEGGRRLVRRAIVATAAAEKYAAGWRNLQQGRNMQRGGEITVNEEGPVTVTSEVRRAHDGRPLILSVERPRRRPTKSWATR